MFDEIQYRLLVKPLAAVYGFEYHDDLVRLKNYSPMIDSLGFDIVLRVDDDDYQGDCRFIFRHGPYYGMLIFGYGSCSGCDALRGCSTPQEVEALRHSLFNDIHWGTARELHDWMRDREWHLQWCIHSAATKLFIAKALDLLDDLARSTHHV